MWIRNTNVKTQNQLYINDSMLSLYFFCLQLIIWSFRAYNFFCNKNDLALGGGGMPPPDPKDVGYGEGDARP